MKMEYESTFLLNQMFMKGIAKYSVQGYDYVKGE